MSDNRPIGIFDSGMGGLTVAHAVSKVMPEEQIVYFGDSAHLPYGDKSAATIQAYSIKICDVLLKQNCKVILIACNSASAAAYELIKAYVGSRAKVLNVIDPVVEYVVQHYSQKQVGLIGTKQTVGSGVYDYKMQVQDPSIQFAGLATPMLVPMIEENYHNDQISAAIIKAYLADERLANLNALILGCTHYPLIKGEIESYYGQKVDVIDSSEIVANSLEKLLQKEALASLIRQKPNKFLVSDITPSFERAAELFFHAEVSLEKHILWE